MIESLHRTIFQAIVVGVLLLAGSSLEAAFVSLDDFQSLTPGGLSGQNGWTASDAIQVANDPADASNQVMSIAVHTVDPTSAVYARKAASLPNNNTGTMFFRMRRTANMNAFAGWSDVAVPSSYPNYENQVGTEDTINSSGKVIVRSGGSPTQVGLFDIDTWYNVWIVSDNSSDTYQVYLEGGDWQTQTALVHGVNDNPDFAYRNSAASNDLTQFFTLSVVPAGKFFFLDDIYIDATGANLSSPLVTPVPEPSALVLVGLGILMGVCGRRRTRG